MGSSESQRESGWSGRQNVWIPLGYSEEDIAMFEKTGTPGASSLRGGGWFEQHEDGRYVGRNPGVQAAAGGDISSVVAAFEAWKAGRQKSEKEHAEYVKLKQERPGRSATILVPTSGPEAKQILGVPNPSKTVLG